MIRKYLTAHGYAIPSPEWQGHVALFKAWYKGYVRDFHRYWVYNGIERRACDRCQLGMAKLVCEDMATLLMNDKVRISCEGFPRLEEILAASDFYAMSNRLIELTMALGTGALVEYLGPDGLPVIDYITADMIYPIAWHGQRITECAFGSRTVVDGRLGYYIQIHTKEGGSYRIRNVWLDGRGREVEPPQGVEATVDTGSTLPLFQFIRPAQVNAIDLQSPMGAPIFATAIEQLKACDIVYDSYVNEFSLGRKRVFPCPLHGHAGRSFLLTGEGSLAHPRMWEAVLSHSRERTKGRPVAAKSNMHHGCPRTPPRLV